MRMTHTPCCLAERIYSHIISAVDDLIVSLVSSKLSNGIMIYSAGTYNVSRLGCRGTVSGSCSNTGVLGVFLRGLIRTSSSTVGKTVSVTTTVSCSTRSNQRSRGNCAGLTIKGAFDACIVACGSGDTSFLLRKKPASKNAKLHKTVVNRFMIVC